MKLKLGLLAASMMAMPAMAAQPIAGVKNIIVLLNDGAGYTVYDAARDFARKPLVVDGAGWKSIGVSTYSLRHDSPANNQPGSLTQEPDVVYNSAKYWDTTPVAGNSTVPGYTAYPAGFAGYEYSRYAHPDSAPTASALANGNKSYNNAINVNGAGDPLMTSAQAAHAAGKATGVVSTVEFADATPAAFGGAHNIARANHFAIADEMFSAGTLDVIGGTGNPDFDNNGMARPAAYNWVSPALWNDLKNGTNLSGKNAQNWTLVQTKAGIQAYANGTVVPPEKLAMIMQADNSTQANRSDAPGTDVATYVPFTTPFLTNTPTQSDLTLAALNRLGQNTNGFYLMSEGGAIDRAEHANNFGRTIEETLASNDNVQSVVDWVNRSDTDATWDNTLLIVTADHDHLLYGPDGATVPYQGLVDNGAGNLPGYSWFGPNHGNGLVPLFAYGRGSDEIAALATMFDSYTDAQGRVFGHGAYTDQTAIGQVLLATAGAVPEPASWALMIVGFGIVGSTMRYRARTASLSRKPV